MVVLILAVCNLALATINLAFGMKLKKQKKNLWPFSMLVAVFCYFSGIINIILAIMG